MDMDKLETYYQAIEMIESQNLLVHFKIQDWPNLKKPQRTKLHRDVYKKAYPNDKSRSLSLADLLKVQGVGRG